MNWLLGGITITGILSLIVNFIKFGKYTALEKKLLNIKDITLIYGSWILILILTGILGITAGSDNKDWFLLAVGIFAIVLLLGWEIYVFIKLSPKVIYYKDNDKKIEILNRFDDNYFTVRIDGDRSSLSFRTIEEVFKHDLKFK